MYLEVQLNIIVWIHLCHRDQPTYNLITDHDTVLFFLSWPWPLYLHMLIIIILWWNHCTQYFFSACTSLLIYSTKLNEFYLWTHANIKLHSIFPLTVPESLNKMLPLRACVKCVCILSLYFDIKSTWLLHNTFSQHVLACLYGPLYTVHI